MLVTSPFISCNQICAALKEKGLPYTSIWLLIGHIMNNIEEITTINVDQKRMLRESFDAYLALIKKNDQTIY